MSTVARIATRSVEMIRRSDAGELPGGPQVGDEAGEAKACHPWLRAELDLVQPELLVLLGATAAKAVLGSKFRLTQHRGEAVPSEAAPKVMATIHPSAVLRVEPAQRDEYLAGLVEDLRTGRKLAGL